MFQKPKKTNMLLRAKMAEYGIAQWQLAKMIGKSENTVWRMMREEMPEHVQKGIIRVIEKECSE